VLFADGRAKTCVVDNNESIAVHVSKLFSTKPSLPDGKTEQTINAQIFRTIENQWKNGVSIAKYQ